jgi:hypothetical protein
MHAKGKKLQHWEAIVVHERRTRQDVARDVQALQAGEAVVDAP